MSYKTIKLEVSGAIATLIFNRPEVLNALNPEMIGEFHGALGDIREMPKLKVLILTGAGKAFVAGADIQILQGFDPLGAKEFARAGQSVPGHGQGVTGGQRSSDSSPKRWPRIADPLIRSGRCHAGESQHAWRADKLPGT